jgi:hypothetical protein
VFGNAVCPQAAPVFVSIDCHHPIERLAWFAFNSRPNRFRFECGGFPSVRIGQADIA